MAFEARSPSRLQAPQTNATMGCLSLGLAVAPAATAAGMATVQQAFRHPRAPSGPGAGQPVSSVGGRRRVGGRAGGSSCASPPPRPQSTNGRGQLAERERRRTYQLIPSISASFIQLDQPSWIGRPSGSPPPPQHLGELHTGPKCAWGKRECLATTAT